MHRESGLCILLCFFNFLNFNELAIERHFIVGAEMMTQVIKHPEKAQDFRIR